MTYRKELSSARKGKNQLDGLNGNKPLINNVSNNLGTNSLENNNNKNFIEYKSIKKEVNDIEFKEVESRNFDDIVNSNDDKVMLPSIEKVNFADKRANLKTAVTRKPIK